MASRRRTVLAEDARQLVGAWRESGESLRAWCARRGIDGRSLRYWADQEAPESVLRLVELTPPRSTTPASGLRLRVSGVTIAIGREFSDEVLVRVLRAVRAC